MTFLIRLGISAMFADYYLTQTLNAPHLTESPSKNTPEVLIITHSKITNITLAGVTYVIALNNLHEYWQLLINIKSD